MIRDSVRWYTHIYTDTRYAVYTHGIRYTVYVYNIMAHIILLIYVRTVPAYIQVHRGRIYLPSCSSTCTWQRININNDGRAYIGKYRKYATVFIIIIFFISEFVCLYRFFSLYLSFHTTVVSYNLQVDPMHTHTHTQTRV